MSVLPREKAGVGSAVSNTIRQVGGALGVATLGAILSSVYPSNLPDNVPAAAKESISGAYGVAERAGAAAPALIHSANDAFMTAVHWASIGSTIFALLGALVALIFLPGKRPAAPAPTASEGLAEEQGIELVEA
jgi:hypothetical protein